MRAREVEADPHPAGRRDQAPTRHHARGGGVPRHRLSTTFAVRACPTIEMDSTTLYTIRELDASTWDVFAELVERNNGIYGGCWCIGYHPECGQRGISHRQVKEDRVRSGRAHAVLAMDENGVAQGWCQYGDPEELPNIKHKREYDKS